MGVLIEIATIFFVINTLWIIYLSEIKECYTYHYTNFCFLSYQNNSKIINDELLCKKIDYGKDRCWVFKDQIYQTYNEMYQDKYGNYYYWILTLFLYLKFKICMYLFDRVY
jgi:hypothetical protein